MANMTKFESIFERFFRRVEKDEDFFQYYNVDLYEAVNLAQKQAKGYLLDALDRLSSIGDLQADFTDYDEGNEVINFEITKTEKKIIVDLMFQVYMERDLPLLHAFKLNFTPSDLTVFSPANERNSYEAFIKRLNWENEIALDDYKSRDRRTGKLRNTINYSAFEDL